jgi:thioredoxin reductase
MSLGRMPDNSGLSNRMISVDSEGYIVTKEFNTTTIVPKIYAIGTCTRGGTKNRLGPVISHLITTNKFKHKEE